MKIFTGNFANKKKYLKTGLAPISIARFNNYCNVALYPKLAPPPHIIFLDEKRYRQVYEDILNGLDPHKCYAELETISEGNDIVLLCYEKEGQFCHRHIVAEWFRRTLKIEVIELGKMENEQIEPTLF